MKILTIIILAILAGFHSQIFAQDENNEQGYLISTKDEAIDMALTYTGLGKVFNLKGKDSLNVTAFMDTASDTTTEYSRKEINNKVIWRVRFRNIILDLSHIKKEFEVKYPKDFEIIIDATSGALLEIRGVTSESKDNMYAFDFENLTARTRSKQGEKYHSLPQEKPAIDFMQALSLSKSRAVIANKIMAVYVMYSYDKTVFGKPGNDTLIPAWTVYFGDIPPFETWLESTMQRIVVNAMTGKTLINFHFGFPKQPADSIEMPADKSIRID